MAHLVKNLPAMRETWVQSLDWKDPLEKGKATDSSILAWRILGHKEWDTTERLSLSRSSQLGGEENVVKGFPAGPVVKNLPCNARDIH